MTHYQDIVDAANERYPITTNVISSTSVSDENDRVRALRTAFIEAATHEREQGKLFARWSNTRYYFNDETERWEHVFTGTPDTDETFTDDQLMVIFDKIKR